MMPPAPRKAARCAIYTRKSTEHNLDLEFNSLDAQREACEAYIKSQAHEGWRLIRTRYDDGGLSGASLDRPALQELLDDVRARKVDIIVVYKVDRLTRSLADFAKLVELFDQHSVSFVSITQSFNTTTSMGRLTLIVVLALAEFEGEVIGGRVERVGMLVEEFHQHSVSFVSITQSFNTTTSMGRLTLNVLLSFAQFEREVIGERVVVLKDWVIET